MVIFDVVILLTLDAHCPKGSIKLPNSDRCFKYFDEKVNYKTAERKCGRGKFPGNLLIMDNDKVFNLFKGIKKR